MHASLVALVAEVDLECLQNLSLYRRKIREFKKRKRCVHDTIFL